MIDIARDPWLERLFCRDRILFYDQVSKSVNVVQHAKQRTGKYRGGVVQMIFADQHKLAARHLRTHEFGAGTG